MSPEGRSNRGGGHDREGQKVEEGERGSPDESLAAILGKFHC